MTALKAFSLYDFLLESNRIEGIAGVKSALYDAARDFLAKPKLSRQDFIDFVTVAQPDAIIRDRPTLNVRVGDHIAPQGGIAILATLDKIINDANEDSEATPYELHVRYETLHPFTDGNGRSGRILWLWTMGGIERAPLGFLHHWYYQSLSGHRRAA